jgi:ABC-type multidrug transport system permease subunit
MCRFAAGVTFKARSVYAHPGRNHVVGIGIRAGILYLVIAFTLGLMTLRNGHGWMFFFGIFLPILWIFGAFMKPPETATAL